MKFPLDWFEPHTPDWTTDRLVPNASSFIDTGFLFAPWNLGIKRVGGPYSQSINGPEAFRGEFITEGGVLTDVDLLEVDTGSGSVTVRGGR